MLDRERSRRITKALEAAPRGTSALIARELGVTPQAVSGWKSTGRIERDHLSALAKHTRRRIEYFLDETVTDSQSYSGLDTAHSRHPTDDMRQQPIDPIQKNVPRESRPERLIRVKLRKGYETVMNLFAALSGGAVEFQVDKDLDLLADAFESLMTGESALLHQIKDEVLVRIEQRKGKGNGKKSAIRKQSRPRRSKGRLR